MEETKMGDVKLDTDVKIGIKMRSSEKDSIETENELKRIVKKIRDISTLTTKRTRMCDGCDKPIGKGNKFKGKEMEEYCEKCSINNNVKGRYKINEY